MKPSRSNQELQRLITAYASFRFERTSTKRSTPPARAELVDDDDAAATSSSPPRASAALGARRSLKTVGALPVERSRGSVDGGDSGTERPYCTGTCECGE